MFQTTLKKPVQCSGVGLHSGKMVTMTMRPAEENSGINFYVTTPQGSQRLTPRPELVIATGLATTIGNGSASVSTVEHLLASIRGLGVDNLRIDAHGGELPIMDGSAAPFVLLIKSAGIRRQNALRRILRVKKKFTHSSGDKSISVEPYAGFLVKYTIDFAHPRIGVQKMSLELTPESFGEVARARTFGFLREVEALYARGLALGGSLDNSVVLDESDVVNPDGLRYPDEFVRHKILDFIGDMAMLDLPLQGRFTVSCSGHALNNQFLRLLNENRDIYLEEVSLGGAAALRKPASAPEGGKVRALPDSLAAGV
ncbi:MAG: UDP-3-O-acyl-N-acetylglucosamine deacetylase [Deltaproteobacteria bacterium]|jgi:UDP-3-O-[3-hydroxymyristoyl] N-acetylglucosamine deacetylase|nr:UDP-3-O-acyl-N-acetylglucosamine deacetylase [Deltaproteobacteria bacterium]